MYQIKKSGKYTVGLLQKARMYNVDNIIHYCESEPQKVDGKLAGRANLVVFSDHNQRKVALKQYLRGGLLGGVNQSLYFGSGGKSRAQLELEWLGRMPQYRVTSAEPLFYVVKEGMGVYKCWMGMYFIEKAVSFLSLIERDFIKAHYLMPLVCIQTAHLINAGVWHVDLHPGNVLVSDKTTITIVDFDRARFFEGKDKKVLAEKYIDRWQRAAKKYKLPVDVGKSFEKGLYGLI